MPSPLAATARTRAAGARAVWPGRVLFKAIARESAEPMALGFFLFCFTFLARQLLRMMEFAVNKGVGVGDLGKLVLGIAVPFAGLTLPMALLLGIMVGFSRLSSDHEIVAMKASGVSPAQMFGPALALATAAWLACAALMVFGYPWGFRTARETFIEIARTNATVGIQERVFLTEFDDVVIYAEKVPVRGQSLEGLLIFDARDKDRPQTIFAKRGSIRSNEQAFTVDIELEDGEVQILDGDRNRLQRIHFEAYALSLDLNARVMGNLPTRDPKEMSLGELRAEVDKQRATPGGDWVRPLLELHRRFAIPFACLVLPLAGIPLGIQPQRSGRVWGFGLSLLLIGFYYGGMVVGEALAKRNLVEGGAGMPVWAAAWLPNALLGIAGATLTWQTIHERPIGALRWLQDRAGDVRERVVRLIARARTDEQDRRARS
ncbi:MAG: LPS export ABC transporter permease LptF [bacterium]